MEPPFNPRASYGVPVLLAWCVPLAIAIGYALVTAMAAVDVWSHLWIVVVLAMAATYITSAVLGFAAALAHAPDVWARSQRQLNIVSAALGLSFTSIPFIVRGVVRLDSDGYYIAIPVASFLIGLVISRAALWGLLRAGWLKAVPGPNKCADCGYELVAPLTACPECGLAAARASDSEPHV